MSPTRTRPKCAGCKRRIPAHAPDLLVRELSEENPRLVTLTLRFHEQCAPAAVASSPSVRRRCTGSRIDTSPASATDMRRERKTRLSRKDFADLKTSRDLVRRWIRPAKRIRRGDDPPTLTREGSKG